MRLIEKRKLALKKIRRKDLQTTEKRVRPTKHTREGEKGLSRKKEQIEKKDFLATLKTPRPPREE